MNWTLARNLFTSFALATTLSFSQGFAQSSTLASPRRLLMAAASDPFENPEITKLTRRIFCDLRKGHIDETLFTPEMAQQLNPAAIALNKPMFDRLGDPTRLTVERRERSELGTKYEYLATFADAQMHVRIFVMRDGRVGSYILTM